MRGVFNRFVSFSSLERSSLYGRMADNQRPLKKRLREAPPVLPNPDAVMVDVTHPTPGNLETDDNKGFQVNIYTRLLGMAVQEYCERNRVDSTFISTLQWGTLTKLLFGEKVPFKPTGVPAYERLYVSFVHRIYNYIEKNNTNPRHKPRDKYRNDILGKMFPRSKSFQTNFSMPIVTSRITSLRLKVPIRIARHFYLL